MIVGIAASIVAICLSISVITGILLANLALHPGRRSFSQKFALLSASSGPAYSSVQTVSITAADGAILKAWYIQPKDFRGASVILLHGVADNREGVEGYAWMFLHHGYAVLMPDSRAHGKSGGEIATYGVLERNDVKQWSEWLRVRTPDCEYLFGESMGAAISIQASPTIPNLCAVVAEDSFESFREIAYDRIAQQTGLSEPKASILGLPAVEAGLVYAKLRYGVYLVNANPIESLTRSKVPTLFDNRHSRFKYSNAPFNCAP
jgi:hypothetical protein